LSKGGDKKWGFAKEGEIMEGGRVLEFINQDLGACQ